MFSNLKRYVLSKGYMIDFETQKNVNIDCFVSEEDHLKQFDSLMETFSIIADYLNIDVESSKTAQGKPSDVFIEAIKSIQFSESHPYNENSERLLFENQYKDTPKYLVRLDNGDYERTWIQDEWDGWKSCAKTRSR
jgi:hypothetical protein